MLTGYAGAYAFDRKSNSLAIGGRLGYYVFDRFLFEAGVGWTHVKRPAEIVESLFGLSLEAEDFQMLFYHLDAHMGAAARAADGALRERRRRLLDHARARASPSFNVGAGTTLFLSSARPCAGRFRDYRFRTGSQGRAPHNNNVEIHPGHRGALLGARHDALPSSVPAHQAASSRATWRVVAALGAALVAALMAAPAWSRETARTRRAPASTKLASARSAWAPDAFLVYIENDEARAMPAAQRIAGATSSFPATRRGAGRTRSATARIVVAENPDIKLEPPPAGRAEWIDSGAALAAAEDGGARAFRERKADG